MKCRLTALFKLCFSLVVILFLYGCLSQIVSFDDYIKANVGHPLSELKEMIARRESYPSRIGWKEKTYHLDNGNSVYVEPVRPDCFVHWEVNQQGIIIGFQTEGNSCCK